MSEQQEYVETEPQALLETARQMKDAGWRFVQCHAMRGLAEGTLDVMYTFADDATGALRSYELHLPAPADAPKPQADGSAPQESQAEDESETSEVAASAATPAEATGTDAAGTDAPAEGAGDAESAGPCVPSLGELFPCAFMFENEMHDLFGIQVSGMTLDYRGGFYHLHIPQPMAAAPEKPAKKTPAAR